MIDEVLVPVGNIICSDDEYVLDQIESVNDITSVNMLELNRLKVTFKNGFQLSIINGKYAHCGDDTFEIAILDNDGLMTVNFFDDEDKGDEIVGYCTLEKISHYMKKVAYL